jgi:hypothetical protein
MNRYFSNISEDCFRTSLANLLLYLKHPIANQIFAIDHPLIHKDGSMHPAVATRLVSYLTNGKYIGRIFIDFIDLEETLRTKYGDNNNIALQIVQEEIDAGRIRPTIYYSSQDLPGLILLKIGNFQQGHWVTQLDERLYVDNGTLKTSLDQYYELVGALKIDRV